MTHFLKTESPWFEKVAIGVKRHEVRLNDRDYKEGDFVVLLHFDKPSKSYSGKYECFKIGYVSDLPENHVVFSLLQPSPNESHVLMNEFRAYYNKLHLHP